MFKDILNQYLLLIKSNSSELSKYSTISPSLISRYRSGERIPKIDSKQYKALINAIIIIANKNNINDINYDNVTNDFKNAFGKTEYDFDILKDNLNTLIELLKINISDISHYLGYDPSYLSKIRSGIRKPAHPEHFVDGMINYIIKNYNSDEDKNSIKNLLSKENNIDENNYYEKLKEWLYSNKKQSTNYINHFFKYIDDFNLDNYIKIIHFDKLKIPYVPFQIPKSKYYYGLEEMKQGELDFFKATILSKSKEDIFMCSDMQMDDLAKDKDFGKKWMFAIAMSIKKGLHINMIHEVNRPLNEMMLGLESWIPIYMTGQISPYYLKNNNNNVYSHLNYVSGDYSLTGECIKGHHSEGKYYLTSNKKENEYYQKKANALLNKADNLMIIYKQDKQNDFKIFLKNDTKIIATRKRILSSLPLHTIPIELLQNIFNKNNIEEKNIKLLLNLYKEEINNINIILKDNILTDEFCLLSKDEFEKENISVSFDNYFINLELKYSYDEYLNHYKETIKYAKNNKNYNIIINNNIIFKNIDIYINTNNYVVITKKKNPNIQFVIKHPKLINAIEKFVPPIIEK